MMKYKVFVADDHQLVIDGIKSMLKGEDDFEIVSYANNGKEAVKKIVILKPDICIIDLDMPLMNGFEVVNKIRQTDKDTKLVILTMHYETPIVEKLIKSGANGYILKNSPKEEFITGLRMIAKGYKYYSSALTERIVTPKAMEFDSNNSIKLHTILSSRELEILALLAEGNSSKEIAEQLNISSKKVDSHRKSLLKKLEVKNAAGMIKVAIKEGLIR